MRDQPLKKPNRLINETSLYLRQHAYNPVDWYPWGEEALNLAKQENKLIFLSIGYSSCHWCHVMERESFENEEIASFLKQHYISIKVDREERPDIDAIYMEAVQIMSGNGGWPLNVWLTPDLAPLYGGTYFPPTSSHHRPGLPDVLSKVLEIYRTNPESVKRQVEKITSALREDVFDHFDAKEISASSLKKAVDITSRQFDPEFGGFSGAPKFPASMHLSFLLKYDHMINDERARSMTLHTLRKMCLGGIYDQIGGGFHRYSTDNRWLVPHFEKMLYDNALLIGVLAEAWQLTGEYLFQETADETVAFIKREMTSMEGAFYSSIDADSDGKEGAFYIWSYPELQKLIDPDDFPVFSAYYDVFPDGNWDNSIIINRSHSSLDFSILTQTNHDDFRSKISQWKTQLLEVRNKRNRPVTDKKIITSWNAMMLSALCAWWRTSLDEDVLDMIVKNAAYLEKFAYNDGNVLRITGKGARHRAGFCDDYSTLSEAFAQVFMVTGDEKWLNMAKIIADTMIEKFYDEDKNCFAFTEPGQHDLIVRKKDLFDNVVPSANSSAISALNLLGKLLGSSEYSETAEKCINALGGILSDHPQSFSYLLQTISQNVTHHAVEIVILGQENNSFLEALSQRYLPFHIVISGRTFENSNIATLKGKVAPVEGSHAYVCKNFTCKQPQSDVNGFLSSI